MPKDKSTKEKPKKQPSPQDAEDQILAYLVQQNRPYSSTDVFNNLQQIISKPNCNKALASLAESNAIQAKTFGKQVIYCALQTAAATTAGAESSDIDLDKNTEQEAQSETVEELQAELATLLEENKVKAKEVAEFESILSVAQLQEQQQILVDEEMELDGQIAALEATKPKQEAIPTRVYTDAEKLQIETTLHHRLLRWKKTRKQFEDLFKDFAGLLGKKRTELAAFREEIGIDEVEQDLPLPTYI